ncbi:MAG: hypothetical protein ACTSQ8_08090 [Candidatus Helarchaeota archaeon]
MILKIKLTAGMIRFNQITEFHLDDDELYAITDEDIYPYFEIVADGVKELTTHKYNDGKDVCFTEKFDWAEILTDNLVSIKRWE